MLQEESTGFADVVDVECERKIFAWETGKLDLLYWDGEAGGRGKLGVVATNTWLIYMSSQWQATSKYPSASVLKIYCKLDPDISGLKGALLGSASLHSVVENSTSEHWDSTFYSEVHLTKSKTEKATNSKAKSFLYNSTVNINRKPRAMHCGRCHWERYLDD